MIYSAVKKKLMWCGQRAFLATTRVTSCISCLYIMICTQQSWNTKCIPLSFPSPIASTTPDGIRHSARHDSLDSDAPAASRAKLMSDYASGILRMMVMMMNL